MRVESEDEEKRPPGMQGASGDRRVLYWWAESGAAEECAQDGVCLLLCCVRLADVDELPLAALLDGLLDRLGERLALQDASVHAADLVLAHALRIHVASQTQDDRTALLRIQRLL